MTRKTTKPERGKSLADLNPALAKQWHPNKNANLAPSDVSLMSGKNVWWKCPNGEDHEWESSICNIVKGNGCPVCSGRKVVKSNCLATLYPHLINELHPTKNGKLTAYDLTSGSNRKVWWKCPRGDDHEWRTSIVDRSSGSTCPIWYSSDSHA